MSGSYDKTIGVWDAEMGVPLLDPLKGHYHWVSLCPSSLLPPSRQGQADPPHPHHHCCQPHSPESVCFLFAMPHTHPPQTLPTSSNSLRPSSTWPHLQSSLPVTSRQLASPVPRSPQTNSSQSSPPCTSPAPRLTIHRTIMSDEAAHQKM